MPRSMVSSSRSSIKPGNIAPAMLHIPSSRAEVAYGVLHGRRDLGAGRHIGGDCERLAAGLLDGDDRRVETTGVDVGTDHGRAGGAEYGARLRTDAARRAGLRSRPVRPSGTRRRERSSRPRGPPAGSAAGGSLYRSSHVEERRARSANWPGHRATTGGGGRRRPSRCRFRLRLCAAATARWSSPTPRPTSGARIRARLVVSAGSAELWGPSGGHAANTGHIGSAHGVVTCGLLGRPTGSPRSPRSPWRPCRRRRSPSRRPATVVPPAPSRRARRNQRRAPNRRPDRAVTDRRAPPSPAATRAPPRRSLRRAPRNRPCPTSVSC